MRLLKEMDHETIDCALRAKLRAEYIRCDWGRLPPEIPLFKVYYLVNGEAHDGYCSGAEGEEVYDRSEFEVVTHDAIPADREPTVEDFAHLDEDVWCMSGSGYCGCHLRHTVTKVERWHGGWVCRDRPGESLGSCSSAELPQGHYLC